MEPQHGVESSLPSTTTSVSFTIQKKSSQPRVKSANLGESTSQSRGLGDEDSSKDYVLSLEGKAIQSTKPQPKEKDYVVPFIAKNRWRLPVDKDKNSPSLEGDGRTTTRKTAEELQLEREAAEAVLRDIQEAQLRASGGDDTSGPVIPLLLQNKPPTVEGREDDEMADVELRPEQSTMDDYEAMPIDRFGEAVLKGMGWKKGEAIGRTNKGLIEPIEFIPRLGGLGLGATPRAPPPEKKRRIKKPGEVEKKVQGPYIDKDGRVKHVKKIGEDIPQQPLEGFVAGNYACVLSGPHRDLQGKIVSVDDVTARVTLRMAINSQLMTFSQHNLELMSKETYVGGGRSNGRSLDSHSNSIVSNDKSDKKYGLITKEDRKREETGKRSSKRPDNSDPSTAMPSSKRMKHSEGYSEANYEKVSRTRDGNLDHLRTKREDDKDRTRTSPYRSHETQSDRSKSKKKKSKEKKLEDAEKEVTRETNWLASNLRVRIVDQRYKNGRYYNTKVVIVDVVSLGTCVCQTDSGKLLEGVTQSMVETVIPRTPNASVMLVGGRRKKELARIIEQDRPKAKAVVELLLSKEVLNVHFDDICEYVGDIDDMDM